MRRFSIAFGGVLVLALCSQAMADQVKPRGGPSARSGQVYAALQQGGGGGAGKRTGSPNRGTGGQQTTIGSATGGAGAGIGRVNACATGPHKVHACASGQH